MSAGAPFRVVIPARYASTRFPGKPLAELAGEPVIRHVHRQAVASGAREVIVATDDRRIAAVAAAFGAQVEMTGEAHRSGTDRIAEVAARRGWPEDAIVVNVQGDAPLVPPASVSQAAELLSAHPSAAIATLATPLRAPGAFRDPNVVKVVTDREGRALYFSRAPIPALGHGAPDAEIPREALRHLGLYAYRVGALRRVTAAAPCYLEMCEQLEQLRALWLGLEIRVGIAKEAHGPDVDTPEDLGAALAFIEARHAGRGSDGG